MDSFTHKWGLEVGGVEVEQKKLYLSLNLRGVGGRINYTPILLTSMFKKKKNRLEITYYTTFNLIHQLNHRML